MIKPDACCWHVSCVCINSYSDPCIHSPSDVPHVIVLVPCANVTPLCGHLYCFSILLAHPFICTCGDNAAGRTTVFSQKQQQLRWLQLLSSSQVHPWRCQQARAHIYLTPLWQIRQATLPLTMWPFSVQVRCPASASWACICVCGREVQLWCYCQAFGSAFLVCLGALHASTDDFDYAECFCIIWLDSLLT